MAGGSFRILIVDDNANNLFTLRAVLERLAGCDIVEASSGLQALAVTLEQPVDLILLDVQMPDMDGYETARHFKMTGRTRDIPIIFVTAVFTAQEFMERGYGIGAVDYLTKPIDDNLLLNRISLYRRLIERERQLSDTLEALRQSEARLSQRHHLILDAAGEGIFGLDGGGRISFINPVALRQLGFGEGDLLGQDFRPLLLPAGADGLPPPCAISACIETGQAQAARNDVFRRGDGSHFPVDYVAAPIVENGGVTGAVVVFHNITERQVAEAALTHKNEELERSNAELEIFAYVASHDLREPLRNVMNYSTLLSRRLGERLGEEEQEYLGFIHGGALRMDQLVRDLLNFSRVGRMSEPMASISMQTVLDTVLGQMQVHLDECGAKVDAPADLPMVLASRDEVERVLINLLGNALKYRFPDGSPHLEISYAREGAMWRFSVRDNGIGISPGLGYENRIFLLFQRLHQRDEYGGGTGLGLAVCKKIIERHGGRIWVESEGEGKGSTFSFTLPAAE